MGREKAGHNPPCQERLSNLIGPYWGTYGIAYRVLQPLLVLIVLTSFASVVSQPKIVGLRKREG